MDTQQYKGNPRDWPDGVYQAIDKPVRLLVARGKAVLFVDLDDFKIEQASLTYERTEMDITKGFMQ